MNTEHKKILIEAFIGWLWTNKRVIGVISNPDLQWGSGPEYTRYPPDKIEQMIDWFLEDINRLGEGYYR